MSKSITRKVQGFFAKQYIRRGSPNNHGTVEAIRVPETCKTADDFLAWGAIFPWLMAVNPEVRLTKGAGSPIEIPGSPDAQPGWYIANLGGTLVPFSPDDFEAKYFAANQTK